ncbi:MAG: MFS transporter [Candidatus Hodarchaeales archaeon]|jgi:MFS family permease
MYLTKFLGINELPEFGQSFLLKVVTLRLFNSFIILLTSTFWILFIIDSIGVAEAGFIVSFMLLIQFILDYPTGSLGDYIGQKLVLISACICYAIGYFLLYFANSIQLFLIISVLNGIGNAQSSGVISSWLDNNYKYIGKNADKERKIYGLFQSRFTSLNNIVLALTFLIGGYLSISLTRRGVFLIQSFLIIGLIILISILLEDLPELKRQRSKSSGFKEYYKYLKGGITFLSNKKTNFFFIVGISIYNLTWLIWGNMVLFLLYFAYTGSDEFLGILRTIVFINGVILRIYPVAWINKRISNSKQSNFQSFLIFIHLIIYFPTLFILSYWFPANNTFHLVGIIILIIIQNIFNSFLLGLESIIRSRIMLDLVPSENRNAIYSLIPSLYSFFGIVALPIVGLVIAQSGLISGIAIGFFTASLGFILIFLAHYYNNDIRSDTMQKTIASVS